MHDQCPSCKKPIAVPASAIGKKARCSACQAVFVVQAPKTQEEVLEVTEVLPDEPPPLDNLEVIADDRPRPVPKGSKKQKKYDADDEQLVPEPVAAQADEGSLDFSREMPKLNAGVRMRITGAANMLMIAATLSIVMSLVMLAQVIVQMMTEPGSVARLVGGLAAVGLLYVLGIIVIPCARSMSLLRSRASGFTAAILCLVASLPGLGAMLMVLVVLGFMVQGPIPPLPAVFGCALGLVGTGQAITCLWGGISALMVLSRADVGDAVREAVEIEARAVYKSPNIVPGACSRAMIWQILSAVAITLNLVTCAGFALYLYWRAAGPNATGSYVTLGITSFFYLLMLLMNIGAVVSLILKRFFVLTVLGSISSLGAAFISYLATISQVPLVLAGLLMQNTPLIVIASFTLLLAVLQNLAGLFGYTSGMDAARLLRKFGIGPVLDEGA
ncbi:MAG TPA: hypothetical protein VFE62_29620 [Gemmataceae bacterium]|nr:hypothetical protein [Gemmataceae bacterium]